MARVKKARRVSRCSTELALCGAVSSGDVVRRGDRDRNEPDGTGELRTGIAYTHLPPVSSTRGLTYICYQRPGHGNGPNGGAAPMNRQSTTVHPHRLVKAFAALSLAVVAAACSAAGSSKGVRSSSTSTSSVVAKSGVTAQLDALKLINYLPEDSPHDTMWTNWNPAVLSTDFARIRSLHANTVRVTVFPPHAYYGYPQPTTVMLQRLHQLVQIASDTGIRVQLALFDSFTTWSDIAGSEQWARSVLQGYANDKEIAFVDIHNELDPDDPQQVAWAKTMLPFVKSIVGSVLVTVSKDDYLGPDAFCRLTRELAPVTPDFWDWHFYGVEGLATGFFERVKASRGPAAAVPR